ncbi:MAG: QVPTGV class sortase B protein-sorting domain-containing protein [Eubacterium sp.]|nr:QVPTGV class sortase B protein-sorting domain-containing protein [Eubacterium sp.]
MNKKLSKIFAVALALVMCFAMAMPAFAATQASTAGSGSITVSKNLIMNSDAGVPEATFSFTLEAYKGDNTYPLFDGIMNGVGSNYTVSFSDASVVTNGLPSDTNGTTTDGKKYATETFTVDFTGVDFTEAGVYRYVITENSVDSPYNISSTNPQYIDVYVEYAQQTDGSYATDLTIQGVFMHTDSSAVLDPTVTPVKSSSFDNMYTTYDLTVGMNVSGNQADKEDYFTFTLTVNSPVNDSYAIDVTNATSNSAITLDVVGGEGTVNFDLKHGESVLVKGLPVGTTYTITDASGTYTATYVVTENGTVLVSDGSGDSYVNSDGIKGDTTVTFTNTRGGVIPTGVILTVAPFAALMLVGIAGATVILKKKRSM